MKEEKFNLKMTMISIKSIFEELEPYMNEIDKENFDAYSSEPYTELKIKALKDLIRIIEKENDISVSRGIWNN